MREPPIITTTAATPQDSPNTTMETGTSFRNWGQPEDDKVEVRHHWSRHQMNYIYQNTDVYLI